MYSLIYLSFGSSARIECELIYSLLSFNEAASSWSKENIQIVIYTDSEIVFPDLLSQCKITIRYVKEQDVEDWINRSNGFTLVVKARVLQDFLFSFKGSVLMLDTDTFFMHDPKHLFEKIEKGNFVMHLKEHTLSHWPLITAFFEQRLVRVTNHSLFKNIHEREMWNSGVVGLSSAYLPLVDEVIYLIEQISNSKEWPQAEWHIIEQLSFSCLFQNQQNIVPAEEVIIHYWFFKPFRYMLAKQFDYFHNNDFKELSIIVKERNVDEKYLIETLPYDNLPSLLVKLIKKYTDVAHLSFNVLPPNTYIGNILRKA